MSYVYPSIKSFGCVPVGVIVAFNAGYYTSSANSGYTHVLGAGNTLTGINDFLNPFGWYVCSGAQVWDLRSPIWNTISPAKYLPNLSDDVFLSGGSSSGVTPGTPGGANTFTPTGSNTGTAVTMNAVTLTTSNMPTHNHGAGTYATTIGLSGTAPSLGSNTVAASAHNHTLNASGYAKLAGTTNSISHDRVDGVASWTDSFSWSPTAAYAGSSNAWTRATSLGGVTANNASTTTVTISNGSYSLTGSNTVGGSSSDAGSGTSFTPTTASVTNPTFTGSATNQRPKYLSVWYIIRAY